MIKLVATVMAFILSATVTACGDPRPPVPTQLIASGLGTPAWPAKLDSQISSWVEQGDPVGAEVLIVRDGETVFHKSYGWSDREQRRPMERHSIFRIRSMSKPFIGTAVLMLRDEGKLDLDERVSTYLPAFDTERHGRITVRDMLSHTSGMLDHDYEDIGLPISPSEYESLEALVGDIAQTSSNGPRGHYRYSSSNSVVLAELVSRLSGMAFEQFLEQRIFTPLKMNDTHTAYDPSMAWSPRMNSTYAWSTTKCAFERYWDPTQPQEVRFFRAAGGVYSTAQDYARFLQMWLNGGELDGRQLLSEKSVSEGLRRHATGGSYGGYGLHMGIFNAPDVDNQGVVFGHAGSDGTLALAFPQSRTVVMFFTQSRDGLAISRFRGALSGLPGFERLESDWRRNFRSDWEASAASGSKLESELIDRLVGRYRNPNSQGPQYMRLDKTDTDLTLVVAGRRYGSLRKSGEFYLSIDPCNGLVVRLRPIPEEAEGALELSTEDNMNVLFLPTD